MALLQMFSGLPLPTFKMFISKGAYPLACLAAAFLPSTVIGQTCDTTSISTTVPANGTELALGQYSYCGGSLNVTAYIANLDYDKVVTLYYTNRQNVSTPLAAVSLGYLSSISGTNYELWGADTPVYIDGITELLNLTYEATDIGSMYVQQLDLAVVASGAAIPGAAAAPAPYATPSGLSSDITSWLLAKNGSESVIAKTRMFLNINPDIDGAVNGTVVAAQSGPSYLQTDPDYEYDWVRDSSLTMDVVQSFYNASTLKKATAFYEQILFEYAGARATEQNDPNLQTGLGEPKFYLSKLTCFSNFLLFLLILDRQHHIQWTMGKTAK